MKNIFKVIAIAIMALSLSNCKKDTVKAPEPEPEATAPATTGALRILFEGMVGDSGLVLSTETYTNQAGNTFNVTMYKYYISNIKITKMDNSVWSEANSYHLIDHSDANSMLITIPNVPFGNYKAIEFMIGVDSAKNQSAGTGALDPANGMCWGWNQGYIMAKMEGTSPQSTAAGQKVEFHIGGWNASISPNVLKVVSPSFNGDTAKVTSSFSPEIHMSNNVIEWFQSPTVIDFSTLNSVTMPGANAKTISDNYADMFTIEHIHNY
jgi:hypothetical protein